MRDEAEIREKMKEAFRRHDNETYGPDREYFDMVAGCMGWVLGEGDDPFMDY